MEDQNKFYQELNKVEFVEKEVIQLKPKSKRYKTQKVFHNESNLEIITKKQSWFETLLKSQIYGSAAYILKKTSVIESKADANIQKASLYGKEYFQTFEFKFACLGIEIDGVKLKFSLSYYNLVMKLIKKLGWYD